MFPLFLFIFFENDIINVGFVYLLTSPSPPSSLILSPICLKLNVAIGAEVSIFISAVNNEGSNPTGISDL